jgi:hypothetical protein
MALARCPRTCNFRPTALFARAATLLSTGEFGAVIGSPGVVHSCATSTAHSEASLELMQAEQLSVQQTATRYWVVQRGAVQLAGAITRQAAEAELDLLRRLSDRSIRRAGDSQPAAQYEH